jgi:hypothetical protein
MLNMSSVSATPQAISKPLENVNRACEACRGLKARCLVDQSSSSGKCQRCNKAGRSCHYAAPQKRRRRKRSDTRVAELEKEVRVMRSLLSKGSRATPEQTAEYAEENITGAGSAHSNLGSKSDGIEESFHDSDEDVGLSMLRNGEHPASMNINAGGTWVGSGKIMDAATCREASQTIYSSPNNLGKDFVDRELISMEMATELFDFYSTDLCVQMPMIVFRPSETAAKVRQEKPTLFLCIVTASAGKFNTGLYDCLYREVLQVFAQRLIIIGDKNLELVQAQLIKSFWLSPPEGSKKLTFYQCVIRALKSVLKY